MTPLLQSSNIDLVDQSIWAIGNVAGENSTYRDLIILAGVIEPICTVLDNA